MKDRVPISKRLVLINSASSLAMTLLNLSVLLWLQRHLLKRIPADEYSILPVLYSAMMFAPLVTIALTGGLGRYVVEAHAQNDDDRVTRIVTTIFPLLLAAGSFILVLGCLFAWRIDYFLTIAPAHVRDAQIMMTLLVIAFTIRLPLAPFGLGLYAHQKMALENSIKTLGQVLRITLLLTLILFVGTRVLYVIVASTTAEVITLVALTWVSLRTMPHLRVRRHHFTPNIARQLLSFGGWNFISAIANTIRTASDTLILNKFATATDVTCFYLAMLPMNQVRIITSTMKPSLGPALTALHATGRSEQLARLYLRAGRYALWSILLVIAPLAIYSRELVRLYVGDGFLQAASIMSITTPIYVITSGCTLVSELAQAKARMQALAKVQIVIQTFNLALTLFLVAHLHLGGIGSALGTLVATALFYPTLMWPLGRRLSETTWTDWITKALVPGLVPALVASTLWFGLKFFLNPDSWLSVGVCIVSGCVVYVLVQIAFCLQPADRDDLQRLFRTLRGAARSLSVWSRDRGRP